jgi:hypothetical protein
VPERKERALDGYEQPRVIATYSIDRLLADASLSTSPVPSDASLKREIENVEQPVERLRSIRTDER